MHAAEQCIFIYSNWNLFAHITNAFLALPITYMKEDMMVHLYFEFVTSGQVSVFKKHVQMNRFRARAGETSHDDLGHRQHCSVARQSSSGQARIDRTN